MCTYTNTRPRTSQKCLEHKQQKQEESYWLISKQATKLVTLNQNSTDINGTEQEPRKTLTYLLPNITDKNVKNTNWRRKKLPRFGEITYLNTKQ